MFFYFMLIIMVIPGLFLWPTKVKGIKHIPKKGRMILVCNHQSFLDAILIALKIRKRRFRFMAKAELFKNKLSSAFFRGLGMYPVNRTQNDITAVKTTLGLLKKEKAICIFPEGTRVKGDEKVDAKNGVALFALKTKSPIVPSCFVNRPGFFKLNKMIIGPAFNLSEMEEFKDKALTKEVLNRATEIIMERMQAIKDEYNAKKKKKTT